MKILNKYFGIFGIACMLLTACNVVELEEPTAIFDEQGNQLTSVEGAAIMATDSSDFALLLADTSSKSWSTSLFTLAGSTMFTACRMDDIMVLYQDGTYQYSGGNNLCGAEDTQASRVGRWEVDVENNRIVFDRRTSNEYIADIIGLSTDELRVSGVYRGMEVRGLYTRR